MIWRDRYGWSYPDYDYSRKLDKFLFLSLRIELSAACEILVKALNQRIGLDPDRHIFPQ